MSTTIGLEINGIVVPMKEGAKIPMVFNSNIFDWDTLVGDYSYPISFPPTANAYVAFGFTNLPESNVSMRKMYDAKFAGSLYLEEKVRFVLRKAGPNGFEGDIQAGNSGLAAQKDLSLRDLDFGGVVNLKNQYTTITMAHDTTYWIFGWFRFYLNGIEINQDFDTSLAHTFDLFISQLNSTTFPGGQTFTVTGAYPNLTMVANQPGFYPFPFIYWNGVSGQPEMWSFTSDYRGYDISFDQIIDEINSYPGEFFPDRNYCYFPVLNIGAQGEHIPAEAGDRLLLPPGTHTQVNAYKLVDEQFDIYLPPGGAGSSMYFPYIVPFPFLKYILKLMATACGLDISGGVYDDSIFNRLVLYNNRSLDAYMMPGDYIHPAEQINLQYHVPKITIGDFLLTLRKAFNLTITTNGSRICIKYTNEIITDTSYIDLTRFMVKLLEVEDGGFTGFKFFWEFSDDNYITTRIKSIEEKEKLSPVVNYSDLPVYTLESFGVICLVTALNKYYYPNNTPTGVVWEYYCDNVTPLNIEDGSKQIIPTADSLYMTTDAGMRMPITSHLMDSVNTAQQAYPLGLRFLFYHGRVASATGELYEYGASDNILPDGSTIAGAWNLLTWEGSDSNYEKNWKKTAEYLKYAKRYTAVLEISDFVMKQIFQFRDQNGFYPKIKLKGTDYIIETIEADFPLNGPTKFTLIKSSWTLNP